MDKQFVLKNILSEEYYDLNDLRYNRKVGTKFTKEEIREFLRIKDELTLECDKIVKLPLKTFNSKHCFYVKGEYLENMYQDYLSMLIGDFESNKEFFYSRHLNEIIMSKIFSEVEGTLNVENVPTTNKRVREVFKSENLTDTNDIIIKNMQNAIIYIANEKPAFNEKNLFKLYNILSKDCLKDGYLYRDDAVYIGGFDGASAEEIKEMMDSLFDFINDPESLKKHKIFLPLIAHYYILYVHPYFDYNGRTARMVSFWISYIYGISEAPLFISEAINENKTSYYEAISNSRIAHNDLTYFLGYILESATKFSLVYKNVEEIKRILANSGNFLAPSELVYLKKILIHNPSGYFNHKMFLKYINSEMSIQGCNKILNNLSKYQILIKSENKKREAIYMINQDMLAYDMDIE